MITILVPTDLSKVSDNAIKYAVAMAKIGNAKIILLHAYHETFSTTQIKEFVYTDQSVEIGKKSDKKLEEICKGLIKEENVNCEYLSQYQLAVDAILDVVKNKNIDLILMEATEAGGLKKLLFGRNVTKIIEKAECPVIVVPENAIFKEIKKITFVTDYDRSDISELKTLLAIAKPFNARINILHVADKKISYSEEENIFDKYLKKITSETHYDDLSFQLLQGENVATKLLEYIYQRSTDMLAISKIKKDFIEKLFEKSITKKLVDLSNIPLIVFHRKKEALTMI